MKFRNYTEEVGQIKFDAVGIYVLQIANLNEISASGEFEEIQNEIQRFTAAKDKLKSLAVRNGKRWREHICSDYGFPFVDEITIY